jgi:hypothetical protein
MASFTLSWATALLALAAPTLAQQVCNGQAAYCDRIWSNITQVGSHDSAFVGQLPTQNQYISVTDQLNMGVRFLQGQTHKDLIGTLSMCHTSCFEEDAGSVQNYLSTIKSWLDGNSNEVVTLLLTNGDNVDPGTFDSLFKAAGLDTYAFVPSGSPAVLAIGDWPTLGDLISSGKRLVFFLDYGADMSKYGYILDEFSYFWETQYDITDSKFSNCSVDRPAGGQGQAAGRMYIMNHFLDLDIGGIDIPDSGAISQTNAAQGAGSIGANAAECFGMYQQNPKGILLDYINDGQAIQAEQQINGVSTGSRSARNRRSCD